MRNAAITTNKPLKIGIVGAGFTGTALVSMLKRMATQPLEIILCDKSGSFGAGPAYSTPFSHHLLNVRVRDMSAFVDEPAHFTDWVSTQVDFKKYFDDSLPIEDQFAPRCLYYQYLQHLLNDIKSDPTKLKITFESVEIIDIASETGRAILISSDGKKIEVDKVVMALGNNPPATFPFSVSLDVNCIHNPWDYKAVTQIGKSDPVLIIGTGLSMIDAVLTLYHQRHEGMIYALSRHGFLPLPHSDVKYVYPIEEALLTTSPLRRFAKQLRLTCEVHGAESGDWRSIINALRLHIPKVWEQFALEDKKRFLRHLLPYWNIHRHRVPTAVEELLSKLSQQNQFKLLGGRVREVKQGEAHIKLRNGEAIQIPINWLINCMGPTQYVQAEQQPLLRALIERQVAMLDPLKLGLAIDASCALKNPFGQVSDRLYAVGALTKGVLWEINAVPDLRNQIFGLARHLLA